MFLGYEISSKCKSAKPFFISSAGVSLTDRTPKGLPFFDETVDRLRQCFTLLGLSSEDQSIALKQRGITDWFWPLMIVRLDWDDFLTIDSKNVPSNNRSIESQKPPSWFIPRKKKSGLFEDLKK